MASILDHPPLEANEPRNEFGLLIISIRIRVFHKDFEEGISNPHLHIRTIGLPQAATCPGHSPF